MALFPGGSVSLPVDADILTFGYGDPQPAGYSIMVYADPYTPLSTLQDPSTKQSYVWSRIVAVEFDEPYGPPVPNSPIHRDAAIDPIIKVPNGSPACNVDPRNPGAYSDGIDHFGPIDTALRQRAADLKALAPKARFWVNLTQAEANYIGVCETPGGDLDGNYDYVDVFNRNYIDVISADWYDASFSTVEPFYEFVLAANEANPDPAQQAQQVALIPGVFSAPHNQLPYLQGYFDYANTKNQAAVCDLPRGPRGFTGLYDGCRIWIVMGWLPGNAPPFVGMLDPASDPIAKAWRAEVHLPPAGLSPQRARAQILPPILQMLQR
jgi:hypothetical protein